MCKCEVATYYPCNKSMDFTGQLGQTNIIVHDSGKHGLGTIQKVKLTFVKITYLWKTKDSSDCLWDV